MIEGRAAGGAPPETLPGRDVPGTGPRSPAPGLPAAAGAGWPAVAGAAVEVALERPGAWAVALAAFLVRGGIVVLAFPIVVLPTPTGLSNVLGPIITSIALTGPSRALLALGGLAIGATVAWLLVSGLAGVAADRSLIRWASGREAATPRRRLWSMLIVRLLAYVPLAAALVYGAGVIGAAIYHELILPDDLTTPLVLRVIREEPWPIVLIIAAWLFGETAGGLAERSIVLDDGSIPRALGRALSHVLTRPLRTLLTVAAGVAAFICVLGPVLVAAAASWSVVSSGLDRGGVGIDTLLASIAFVAIWLGGLILVGAVAAWRSVMWTLEVLARGPDRAGSAQAVSARGGSDLGGTDAGSSLASPEEPSGAPREVSTLP